MGVSHAVVQTEHFICRNNKSMLNTRSAQLSQFNNTPPKEERISIIFENCFKLDLRNTTFFKEAI